MSETRDQYIKVYLTKEEKETVTEKAEKQSTSTSTLARIKLLDSTKGEQA